MPSIAKIFGARSVRPGNKTWVFCRIYTPEPNILVRYANSNIITFSYVNALSIGVLLNLEGGVGFRSVYFGKLSGNQIFICSWSAVNIVAKIDYYLTI